MQTDLFGNPVGISVVPTKRLEELLKDEFGNRAIDSTEIPRNLLENLNPEFTVRPYQKRAFQNFLQYWEAEGFLPRSMHCPHLLYLMATGSGKTMIMAGLILYLYQKGYRRFLFFVNSNSIIEKTRDNFLNPASSKYLFNPSGLVFEGERVHLQEVASFASAHPDCINICFTTIQGLHTRLNNPSENALTFEDFEGERVILLSDEAHHINALTKKGVKMEQLKADEQIELMGWERTVHRIHKSHPANALIEFTATVDMADPNIAAKYTDKLLFDYSLRKFREEGYSKEIKVLQADMPPMERALIALVLSQYRRKVFEHHGQTIKPVILFKSKTIAESKQFCELFVHTVKQLDGEKLKAMESSAQQLGSMQTRIFGSSPGRALYKAFEWFRENKITLDNLALELREDFREDKCLAINSKEDSVAKQLAVNSLEDKTNEYRAIFAVDMLNEGWDVLNLFDIVRLYDTQSGKGTAPSKTTMSEAQLIGRGARYCPFTVEQGQPVRQRKYDNAQEQAIRICEELFYHAAHNPNYITELNTALQQLGLKDKLMKERELKLKKEFRETGFYKAGLVYSNRRIEDEDGGRFALQGLPKVVLDMRFKTTLYSGALRQSTILGEDGKPQAGPTVKTYNFSLSKCPAAIKIKSLHKLRFYHFNSLQYQLPNLSSAREFVTGETYLGAIKVEVTATPDKNHEDKLTPDEWLHICTRVLEQMQPVLEGTRSQYRGSREFYPEFIYKVFDNKIVSFAAFTGADQEFGLSQTTESDERKYRLDISKLDWYAYEDNFGTSEEKLLVKYFDRIYDDLKQKWEEVFLIRNEQVVKLYTFDGGQKFYPDFILFLSRASGEDQMHYQVFIEPKGTHLLAADAWKEQFLQSLKQEHKIEQLHKGRKFTVWGLPFFNQATRMGEFENAISLLS